jgi:hypothetical protein
LQNYIHHNPDVILGCESKIDQTFATYEVFPENYTVYRKDRTEHGGGVFIATRDSLITSSEPSFDEDCEVVWAKIQFANSKPLILGSFYRTQGVKTLENFFSSFSNALSKNSRQHPNVIVGGDFNLADIDWKTWQTTNIKTKAIHERFLNFLFDNSLSQLVTGITRPVSNSTLDLLVTTNPNLIENIEILPGMSDHCLVMFDICMKPKLRIKPKRKIYMYHKADIPTLKEHTQEFVQHFLNSNPGERSVNENWEIIRDKLLYLADIHIPSKMSKSKHNLPWVSPKIKRKMRKRDKLFSKARKSNSQQNWKAYKKCRNQVTNLVRKSHNEYVNSYIGPKLSENPKCFYSYLNLKKTENLGVPTLKTQSKICSTDAEKAEALNLQFESAFTSTELTQVSFEQDSAYDPIPHLEITIAGVAKQLRELNGAKSSGPDEVTPRLLKLVAEDIAPAYQFLYQQSYDNNVIPDEWRKALVTPIYKGGPKSEPSNYRPISLTCISCKVMEHIVLSHIAKHLNSNNILIDEQHGFRERLSTVTQLISSTNDWAETLNNRGQTDIILLDFSKAFDRVSHHHLLAKLSFYGIRNDTLGWVGAFLSHRKQSVSVNGTHSSWVDVTSGVPQGSVLGPALFLLYINDIKDKIHSSLKLFADDSILYREINDQQDHTIIQEDLQTLSAWSSKWLMSFNIKKCAVMTITRKRKPSLYQYSLSGENLTRVDKHDYLGVTISEDLRWGNHINKVTRKASQTLGLLRRSLSPCSKQVKAKAYETLVRPKVEYASEVWNPNTAQDIEKVEKIQRNAARFVHADYRRTTHVTPLINELDWDSLHTRRLIKQATMLYRIHYGLVFISPPNCFHRATKFFRLDHPLKYISDFQPIINPYKYSFYPRAVQIWNRLPPSAILHIHPSTAFFQLHAVPAIREMQPKHGNTIL